MKKQIRHYTKEFKIQTLKLAVELGSVSKAANQLGVPEANLYVWRKKFSDETIQPKKDGPATTAEVAKENQRLQQEVAHLKKVNHILKAAAAFFSQDHLK